MFDVMHGRDGGGCSLMLKEKRDMGHEGKGLKKKERDVSSHLIRSDIYLFKLRG